MIDYISIISQQVSFNFGKIIRISRKNKNFITNYKNLTNLQTAFLVLILQG